MQVNDGVDFSTTAGSHGGPCGASEARDGGSPMFPGTLEGLLINYT